MENFLRNYNIWKVKQTDFHRRDKDFSTIDTNLESLSEDLAKT